MRSERVQAAHKAAQKARIEAKVKKGYVDAVNKDGTIKSLGFLNSQPIQRAMVEVNEGIRRARSDLFIALDDLEVSKITGDGMEAATEAAQVATLVVQNREAAKQNSRRKGVSLTNSGSA